MHIETPSGIHNASSHEPSPSETKTKTIVADIYKSTWAEFYEWASYNSAEVIESLRVHNRRYQKSGPLKMTGESTPQTQARSVAVDWSKASLTVKPLRNTFDSAAYESCAPIVRNHIAEKINYADFVPYADDPSFPNRKFLRHFEKLNWDPTTVELSAPRDPDGNLHVLNIYCLDLIGCSGNCAHRRNVPLAS
jgi:hypothetical protein